MTAKIPRQYLRLKPEELLPGEHGILQQFDIIVDKKRRIYVKKTANFTGTFGVNEWPNHRDRGEALLRKRKDGKYDLLIRSTFSAIIDPYLDKNSYHDLIAIEALEILGSELKECETCHGAGIVKTDE